jgi:hypothetical protein
MKTCGTCRFFGKVYDRIFFEEENGELQDVSVTRLHVCELLKHLNKGGEAETLRLFRSVPAGVIDGSGYHATFCVSEEFGCNQWRAKEGLDGR